MLCSLLCLLTVVFKHLSELYLFLLFGQQYFFHNVVDISFKVLLCLSSTVTIKYFESCMNKWWVIASNYILCVICDGKVANVNSFRVDYHLSLQKNEVKAESAEAPKASETETVEEQEKPPAPPVGEVASPPAGGDAEKHPASPEGGEVEQPEASPACEEDAAESSGSTKEEQSAVSGHQHNSVTTM